MKGFTAKQVVALTGVPYKRLDSWANSGFLMPSIAEADGTGSRRLYSFQDLVALRTAKLEASKNAFWGAFFVLVIWT